MKRQVVSVQCAVECSCLCDAFINVNVIDLIMMVENSTVAPSIGTRAREMHDVGNQESPTPMNECRKVL